MTNWTKRTTQFNSPAINSDSDVINSVSETISGYGTEASWNNRSVPTQSEYSLEYGLWIKNYHPWKATAYPWQRDNLSTNWTDRTPI